MEILLASLNSKFVHTNLALRYLKEYNAGYDIEIMESTINDHFCEFAYKIIEKKPKLAGFSCYIWNIELTLKVCSIIKQISPSTLILLGGPEVTYENENFLVEHEYIDFLILGEGEKPLSELLREYDRDNPDYANISGLIYRSEEKILVNPSGEPIQELDCIPFPYRQGVEPKILYYEASRGCPFQCSYCLSGACGKVRFFSLERVKQDLLFFLTHRVELVKFVDRTFNADKKFAYQIWEYLIEKTLHNSEGNSGKHVTKFHFEIAMDLMDEELLELLSRAPRDLFQFEIGVQTTNAAVLKNINRVMDFEKIKANYARIKSYGNIHCHFDLIAGLPGEGMESFQKSFEDCMELRPEVLQLGFLKVLSGTALMRQKGLYGIEHIAFPNYQVLQTRDIRFAELRELMKLEKVFETYYNSGVFRRTMAYMMEAETVRFSLFQHFTQHLSSQDFFDRPMDYRDKLWNLFEFGTKLHGENVMKDLLLHDVILHSKKAVLPDYLQVEQVKNRNEMPMEIWEELQFCMDAQERKRLILIPVGMLIVEDKGTWRFKQQEALLAFNPENEQYCYIIENHIKGGSYGCQRNCEAGTSGIKANK